MTVNAVCPGFTETPLIEAAVANIVGQDRAHARRPRAPNWRRPIRKGASSRPEEVADCVLWLASPGAGSINGQAIPVAGGEVLAG